MPEFIKMLSELRQHMQAELTRSDVLRALIWPTSGLAMLFIAALGLKAPAWILSAIFYILCGFLALYALAYVVCFFIDRDALRSEKYKLHKLAIERGLYGDSTMGLKDISEASADTKLIEATPTERGQ